MPDRALPMAPIVMLPVGVGPLELALGAAPAGDRRRAVGRGARARAGLLHQPHAGRAGCLVPLRSPHRAVPAAWCTGCMWGFVVGPLNEALGVEAGGLPARPTLRETPRRAG